MLRETGAFLFGKRTIIERLPPDRFAWDNSSIISKRKSTDFLNRGLKSQLGGFILDPVKQALHQRNKQKWKQIILDCRRSGLSDRMYNEDKSDASERTELVVEYHGASIVSAPP